MFFGFYLPFVYNGRLPKCGMLAFVINLLVLRAAVRLTHIIPSVFFCHSDSDFAIRSKIDNIFAPTTYVRGTLSTNPLVHKPFAFYAPHHTLVLSLSRVMFLLVRSFRFRKKIQPIMCAVKMGGDQTALTGTVSGHLYSWNVGAPSSDMYRSTKQKNCR